QTVDTRSGTGLTGPHMDQQPALPTSPAGRLHLTGWGGGAVIYPPLKPGACSSCRSMSASGRMTAAPQQPSRAPPRVRKRLGGPSCYVGRFTLATFPARNPAHIQLYTCDGTVALANQSA